jgi:hypothetical protein
MFVKPHKKVKTHYETKPGWLNELDVCEMELLLGQITVMSDWRGDCDFKIDSTRSISTFDIFYDERSTGNHVNRPRIRFLNVM